MLSENHGAKLMLVHIFRGSGRVFGFMEDATGANLPSQISPWPAFKPIDLSRDGEPRPEGMPTSVWKTLKSIVFTSPMRMSASPKV